MKVEWISDTGFLKAENTMDLLARRQEALAANLANIDTPGYRTVDLAFGEVLDGELQQPYQLVRTSPGHLEALQAEAKGPALREVDGLISRADGNNVRLERELVEMTMNRLRFDMATRWAQSRIKSIQRAIQGGGNG